MDDDVRTEEDPAGKSTGSVQSHSEVRADGR